MTHTIDDLRDHLFATISALRDPDNPMPIDRAKAVADVAQTVINSAKVEVDMINAVGRKQLRPTGFLGLAADRTIGTARPALNGVSQREGIPPQGPTARP